MPSGNTHEFTNMVFLPISLTCLQPDGLIPFIAGYLFSTFYLSPDLDLPQSKSSQRWGKLSFIWKYYQAFVPHRSLISHLPVISSLIRILYLLLPLFLTTFIIFKVIDEVFFNGILSIKLETEVIDIETEKFIKDTFIYFIYGVIIADTIHILLDFSLTFLKRFWKNLTKKIKFLKV